MMGLITLGKKCAGARSAGNPHAACEAEGAGNVAMGAGLRARAKALDNPPDPYVRAPVLDPTETDDNTRLLDECPFALAIRDGSPRARQALAAGSLVEPLDQEPQRRLRSKT